MSRNGGGVARHIIRNIAQDVSGEVGDDFGFADVAVKLFEQLEVGETQTGDFDAGENLIRPGFAHGFVIVEDQLVGSGQLHGALMIGNRLHK